MKEKTKNKGEVSEFYVFVYILGNRLIPVVDGNLVATGDAVKFNSIKHGSEEYIFTDDNRIKILAKGETSYVPSSFCKEHSEELLSLLLGRDKIKDNDEIIQGILRVLRADKITAKSSDKMDFSAEVCIPQSPLSRYLGFSIKSYIGEDPTLLNANKENSLIRLEILKDGLKPSDNEMDNILTLKLKGIKKIFTHLIENGFKFAYSKCGGNVLEYNLRMIDSSLPQLLARMLVERYINYKTKESFSSLVAKLAKRTDYPEIKELGETEERRKISLNFKFQNFLFAFSTGATVSKFWNGRDQATGGFIIVTKNGAVDCLELTTRNAMGEYLMNFSYFDNPSTKRHNYGSIYKGEGGRYFIDLQLQVRITD